MKKYEKMLIAIKDADFNCFANKGDWLYIANNKDTKKGLFRLPNYIYYFVSIDDERMPSEIGVVKKLMVISLQKNLLNLIIKVEKRYFASDWWNCERIWMVLEKVNAQPEHTPMAVTCFEKVLPKNEKELRVHKKFFTGLSKEEKKELLEI